MTAAASGSTMVARPNSQSPAPTAIPLLATSPQPLSSAVVGAILDNGNSHRHHSDNYYPKPRPRRYDQSIDPTPQFDNQGNPNFDTHGNYQGPHGLGKLVTPDDNPDLNPALRSDGDDSDDDS
ncbi:hypothetical protein NKI72_11330 [Mesorhizobium sp. M0437]|uniref:hypothetical protein n=1 Tax=Mesorhizobium sp. M0437 TaxID=2956945 RepID=UPI003339F383